MYFQTYSQFPLNIDDVEPTFVLIPFVLFILLSCLPRHLEPSILWRLLLSGVCSGAYVACALLWVYQCTHPSVPAPNNDYDHCYAPKTTASPLTQFSSQAMTIHVFGCFNNTILRISFFFVLTLIDLAYHARRNTHGSFGYHGLRAWYFLGVDFNVPIQQSVKDITPSQLAYYVYRYVFYKTELTTQIIALAILDVVDAGGDEVHDAARRLVDECLGGDRAEKQHWTAGEKRGGKDLETGQIQESESV